VSLASPDIVQAFVEDSREHLGDIEANLMDIESAGEGADPELINSVFRAAHSIKGGAGMLGFDTIKELAHKLENVLHMVRSKELVIDGAIVNTLLAGFDKLLALVENIEESESASIAEHVEKLQAIAESKQAKPAGTEARPAVLPGPAAKTFDVDAVSLAQAREGGNDIYLLEYDLIHDIHGEDKTPFQVMKVLQDAGRIVDCKVDIAAVGGLDGDFSNKIPFFVLFASILEPQHVGLLTKLPAERIVKVDEAAAAALSSGANFGEYTLTEEAGRCLVRFPRQALVGTLGGLKAALLAAFDRCQSLALDFSGVEQADVFLFQLLCSAQRTFAGGGKGVEIAGAVPPAVQELARASGFSDASLVGLGLSRCVFVH
jgi:HPt (histidine-containing phosphotransfer) domain-containing protein/ABC-type transporter Mla MlaB component